MRSASTSWSNRAVTNAPTPCRSRGLGINGFGPNPIPVTVLTGSGGSTINIITADWLNTPHIIQNPSAETIWTWDHYAFGDNSPNSNPYGVGTFTYNPRFPGQYADSETSTFNNGMRDTYIPGIGRYGQIDPIGLNGGSFSTYAYVGNNPLINIDPMGHQVGNPVVTIVGAGFVIGTFIMEAWLQTPAGQQAIAQLAQSISKLCDKAGNPVSTIAQSLNAPGNCTPQEQQALQSDVDNACKQPRACAPGTPKAQLPIFRERNLECALARTIINNKCFAGGNVNHRNEAINAYQSVYDCEELMSTP